MDNKHFSSIAQLFILALLVGEWSGCSNTATPEKSKGIIPLPSRYQGVIELDLSADSARFGDSLEIEIDRADSVMHGFAFFHAVNDTVELNARQDWAGLGNSSKYVYVRRTSTLTCDCPVYSPDSSVNEILHLEISEKQVLCIYFTYPQKIPLFNAYLDRKD